MVRAKSLRSSFRRGNNDRAREKKQEKMSRQLSEQSPKAISSDGYRTETEIENYSVCMQQVAGSLSSYGACCRQQRKMYLTVPPAQKKGSSFTGGVGSDLAVLDSGRV